MNIFKFTPSFILAPMAGYTDSAFRQIVKEYGADFVFTEMISVYSIKYALDKIKNLIEFSNDEKPIGIQLFGNEPDLFYEAAQIAENLGFDLIDINMGCPVKKVINAKSGAYLLTDLKLAERIMKKTVKATKLPVSIKIRSGWSDDKINFLEINKIAEDNGIKIITLHSRTKTQGFSGKANWEHIKLLKEKSKLFIAGNGDVVDRESAKRMLSYTGCDAVMIGRGSLGNPFIFKEIKNTDYSPSLDEVINVALKHFKISLQLKREKAIYEMRKHFVKYFKNFKNAKLIRKELLEKENEKDIIYYLKELKKR